MKTKFFRGLCLGVASWLAAPSAGAQTLLDTANPPAPTSMDQVEAVAGKQYRSDGLSFITTQDGALLSCSVQKLESRVTGTGLWLSSTAEHATHEPFRVRAVAVSREISGTRARGEPLAATFLEWFPGCNAVSHANFSPLTFTGTVETADRMARFIREGLVEEYSVSVDGVRQDFILEKRPGGEGELRVELDVTGAKAEALVNGVRLSLDGSGRKLAYSRLSVTDAGGQALAARLEVMEATRLAVVVDDATAIYPVRIDPTFSDADWNSMGGLRGANGTVYATVVDGAGNLYIAGDFTIVGEVLADRVAKWNGSTWSALASGVGGGESPSAYTLAVSGGDLYVGGNFTTAGGRSANYVAKWNGSSWSALGSGVGGAIAAMAVSGTDLYVGGWFMTAGGTSANYVARWNGNAWSALGSGVNSDVHALAVSGTDLYVGGWFRTAGGSSANYVAKWNGSTWSALGSGVSSAVYALAVSGTSLYVGGAFITAGGSLANYVAKWNGSAWSSLGSGLYPGTVSALALSGNDLYVGGRFSEAGGSYANNISKWDGSAWSALGSGMNGHVFALAADGAGHLFVGGGFFLAGTNVSPFIAQATIGANHVANGLYLTNATVSPEGLAHFEVVTPSNGVYSLLVSTNLRDWESVENLEGPTNRFTVTWPDPPWRITDFKGVFVRAAVGLVPQYHFYLNFYNSAGILVAGTPGVLFPQSVRHYSAFLEGNRLSNPATATNVFFSGPPGSGLTNALPEGSELDPEHYGKNYWTPSPASPATPPPGRWAVNYAGTNLFFDQLDALTRFVIPHPTVVVSTGLLISVNWVYRDATTGQALGGPPAFVTEVVVEVFGDTPSQRIYDSDHLPRETTNHTFSPSIQWSEVDVLHFSYHDDFDNCYRVSYAK